MNEPLEFIGDNEGNVFATHWPQNITVTSTMLHNAAPEFWKARVDNAGIGKCLIRTTNEWALYRLTGWVQMRDVEMRSVLSHQAVYAELVRWGKHDRDVRKVT